MDLPVKNWLVPLNSLAPVSTTKFTQFRQTSRDNRQKRLLQYPFRVDVIDMYITILTM